jgi:hypothetical protein
MHYTVLSKQVIDSRGVQTVRRYILGHHPGLGKLHWGLQGAETVVETTHFKPWRKFMVTDSGRSQP